METTYEGVAVVHVLATVLDRLCIANVAMAQADPGQVTKFHAMKAPGIGILHYLERIHKYASCSKECFILALIYIDRLIQRNNFLLTELNVHRVVITAILLAAKFFDDAYYNNAYYAKVGGVLVSEMNGLEVDFLFRINFSLHVTPEVFDKYRMELLSQVSSCYLVPQMPIPTPSIATGTCSTTVLSSPPQQQPSSPAVLVQSSPQITMCNPQAPSTHNFTVAPQQSYENPFVNAHPCAEIVSSPGMSWVQSSCGDRGCNTNADQSFFPIQFSDGFVQVQRSQSYPTTDGGIHSLCGVATTRTEAPYTAPVIITPGVAVHYPIATPAAIGSHASTMAAMMEQHLFPLQSTMVHHNHHHRQHHRHPYVIQQQPDARDRPAMVAAAAGAH